MRNMHAQIRAEVARQEARHPDRNNNVKLGRGVSGYITQAATELSEADYAFKPVDSVRSFGQIIGHLAGSQYMFCAPTLRFCGSGPSNPPFA